MTFDDRLYEWGELADRGWPALLIGNGASQAVWPRFGYQSLFEVARDEPEAGLSARDIALFGSLSAGSNFERVLGSLRTAQLVSSALKLEDTPITVAYESIRNALVEAVHKVHITYAATKKSSLQALRNVITSHEAVFTTNYDLLPYWAAMVDPPAEKAWEGQVADFFWSNGNGFDATNIDLWRSSTPLYYLHGALHLRRTLTSATTKVVAREDQSLLDVIAEDVPGAWPLFVSEGTAEAKLETFRSSAYLSFCFQKLADCEAALVLFGHSLGDEDDHLATAVDRVAGRRIAISLYRPQEVVGEMHRLKSKLPTQDISFFDAESHPLGDHALRSDLAE